ncbi:hypothetical protein [Methylomonas sp. MgM2]
MIWLLLLHISAVVCWCGSLLYLFAFTAGVSSQPTPDERQRHPALILKVLSHFATPAALIAIISGTIMMFLFAVPAIEGLALYLVPKMIGARFAVSPAQRVRLLVLSVRKPDPDVEPAVGNLAGGRLVH